MEKMKRDILICDIMMWSAFICMILCRFMTTGIFAETAQNLETQTEVVAQAVEVNPIMAAVFSLQKSQFAIMMFVLPAMAMALYYFYRRRTKQGKFGIDNLMFFVTFAFFVFLINIFNDFAYFVAVVLG